MSSHRILYHHRIRADDGQAVHVRELIGALRAAGHDVAECALVRKAHAATGGASGPSWWRWLRLPRRATELAEILYSRRGARMLVAAAQQSQPEFLYERHALHCDAGLQAARTLRIPLLLEVNSPMCDEMQRLGLLRFPARARATERRVLGGADAVFAVTAVLRDRLVEAGADPARCHVVPNGADPARYASLDRAAERARLQIAPETPVVGFVGHARPWHRLDLLLEAIRTSGSRDALLLLAGDGPAFAPLLAAAAASGIGARVRWLGAVPPDALPGIVCTFDVAVIPAINSYASPLKLFDSFAAGVATVAPDQPNLRETIEDGVNGLLFAPQSAPALAQALQRLLADPVQRARIGAAGRARLLREDWTWAGNARRVVAAYEALR